MKSFALGVALLSALFLSGFTQTQRPSTKVELSGKVVDADTGESLSAVQILVKELSVQPLPIRMVNSLSMLRLEPIP